MSLKTPRGSGHISKNRNNLFVGPTHHGRIATCGDDLRRSARYGRIERFTPSAGKGAVEEDDMGRKDRADG